MEGELEERRSDFPNGESKDADDHSTTVDSHRGEESLGGSVTPQFETLDGSYHFTLSGYSLAKGIGSGQYFSSGAFGVGGHEWAIYFYPNGKNPEDHSEFVSVFVALTSDSFNVQVLFEIVLLDQSGNGKHKTHSHFSGGIESPYILEKQGSMWGYARFLRRDELEVSGFLKADTLEFTGRVGVLLSSIKPIKLSTTPVTPIPQQDDLDDNTSHQQSSVDCEPSPEDGFVRKVKGSRLEDELARYHLRLMSTPSPIKFSAEVETREELTS